MTVLTYRFRMTGLGLTLTLIFINIQIRITFTTAIFHLLLLGVWSVKIKNIHWQCLLWKLNIQISPTSRFFYGKKDSKSRKFSDWHLLCIMIRAEPDYRNNKFGSKKYLLKYKSQVLSNITNLLIWSAYPYIN